MNSTETVNKAQFVLDSLDKLPGKDKAFASSLCSKVVKNKGGTPKQEFWVGKLADQIVKPQPLPGAPPEIKVGQFGGVYALFAEAKKHLKWPKINLQLHDGSPVQLYLAGQGSKKPGVVNVTNGGNYGHAYHKWYGRVLPDGGMEVSVSGHHLSEFPEVKELLKKLAAQPAEIAAAHGKLTGRCCFCNKPLSDEKSTAAGFGPVCAVKFGLGGKWKQGENWFKIMGKGMFKKAVAEEAATVACDLAVAIENEALKSGECPSCGMDIAAKDMEKPCSGCGALPPGVLMKKPKMVKPSTPQQLMESIMLGDGSGSKIILEVLKASGAAASKDVKHATIPEPVPESKPAFPAKKKRDYLF